MNTYLLAAGLSVCVAACADVPAGGGEASGTPGDEGYTADPQTPDSETPAPETADRADALPGALELPAPDVFVEDAQEEDVNLGADIETFAPPPVPAFWVNIDSGRDLNDPVPIAIAGVPGGLLAVAVDWIARLDHTGKPLWHVTRPDEVSWDEAAAAGSGAVIKEGRWENPFELGVPGLAAVDLDGARLWTKSCDELAGFSCHYSHRNGGLAALGASRFVVMTSTDGEHGWLAFALDGSVISAGTLDPVPEPGFFDGERLLAGGERVAVLNWSETAVRVRLFHQSGDLLADETFMGVPSPGTSLWVPLEVPAALSPAGDLVVEVGATDPTPSFAARVHRLTADGAVAPPIGLTEDEKFEFIVAVPAGGYFTVGQRPVDGVAHPRMRRRWGADWSPLGAAGDNFSFSLTGPLAVSEGVFFDSGAVRTSLDNPGSQGDVYLRATPWPPPVEAGDPVRHQLSVPLGDAELGPSCDVPGTCVDWCGVPMFVEPIPPPSGMTEGPGSIPAFWYHGVYWHTGATGPVAPIDGNGDTGMVVEGEDDTAAWVAPTWNAEWIHHDGRGFWAHHAGRSALGPSPIAILDGAVAGSPALVACLSLEPGQESFLGLFGSYVVTGDSFVDLEGPTPGDAVPLGGSVIALWQSRVLVRRADDSGLVTDLVDPDGPPIATLEPSEMLDPEKVVDGVAISGIYPGVPVDAIDLAATPPVRYEGQSEEDCWVELEPVDGEAAAPIRLDLRAGVRRPAGTEIACPRLTGRYRVLPQPGGPSRIVQRLNSTTSDVLDEHLDTGKDLVDLGHGAIWTDAILYQRGGPSGDIHRLDPATGAIMSTVDIGTESIRGWVTDGDDLYVSTSSGLARVGPSDASLTPLPVAPFDSDSWMYPETLLGAPGAVYTIREGRLLERLASDGTVLATVTLPFERSWDPIIATDLGLFVLDVRRTIHWYSPDLIEHRVAVESEHFRPLGGAKGALFGLKARPGGVYLDGASTLAVYRPVTLDSSTFGLEPVADSGSLAAAVQDASGDPAGDRFWAIEWNRTVELVLVPTAE